MKKLFALAVTLAFLGTLAPAAVRAADAAKGEKKQSKLTEEQQKLWKEVVGKYDANKDGKLDKEERAKISKEDKEKLKKAGIGARGQQVKGADKKKASN
jgi:hypothetical protein